MLFLVHIRVPVPPDMPAHVADQLRLEEQQAARRHPGAHLWRVVGRQENYSVSTKPPTATASTPP